jgi:hypothetical protein
MAVADDDLISAAADRPCGFGRWATELTAAINLDTTPTNGKKLSTCKGKPNRILMQCEAQNVRWTDDPDVDPSASIGMLMIPGTLYEYSGDLSKLRFIQAAATAILVVSFYNS